MCVFGGGGGVLVLRPKAACIPAQEHSIFLPNIISTCWEGA